MKRRTVNRKRITLPMRQAAPLEVERPRVRADCVDGPRPCPWVGCRHHLYLDVKPNGSIVLNRPDLEPWELDESCSLDVAERGASPGQVAVYLGVTRWRVFQLRDQARLKLQTELGLLDQRPCLPSAQ